MGPVKKIKQLVIDSGAFLKNVSIWDYGEEFFVVQDVIYEIKDKQAKQFINSLPVQLNFREPSAASVKFINEFTKKTGDYSSLSAVDTKVLSLTYELEIEARGGSDHLRNEPVQRKPISVTSRPPVPNEVEGFYLPASHRGSSNQVDDKKETESKTSISEICDLEDSEDDKNISTALNEPSVTEATETVSSLNISTTSNAPSVTEIGEAVASLDISKESNSSDNETSEVDEDSIDDDEDDDEGWITPSNIKTIKGKYNSVCEDDYKDIEVACITSDFAVQNTLLHIGLSTIGVDGNLIKSLRMYTLRCFVCQTLCNDMEKRFCKNCGYKTLKKVSYTLNPDGSKYIWLSKKPINIRGTKYSLPAPRGGKHAVNPILCSDQRVPQMRPSKRFLQRNDPMHEDYASRSDIPFLRRSTEGEYTHEVSKHQGTFYWEKRNPNDPGRNVRNRRKR